MFSRISHKQQITKVLFSLFLGLIVTTSAQGASSVLIVVENLRPLDVAEMPNLKGIAKRGVVSSSHHAVYPPAPHENAASLITGTYPRSHGYLNLSSEDNRPTVATIVDAYTEAKETPLILSANSRIAAMLPKGAHFSSAGTNAENPNEWVANQYLAQKHRPAISILWFANAPSARKEIDVLIGEIAKHHGKRKLDANIFVTSTGAPIPRPSREKIIQIVQEGVDGVPNMEKVSIGDWYVSGLNGNMQVIRKIVAQFQREESVGSVFTDQIRVTHPEGKAPGALSFESVFIDHERKPDIAFDAPWSENLLAIPLVAAGPDIKTKTESNVPSANLDLAPTLLHVGGVKIPESMTGRVLQELLNNGPAPEDIEVLKRRSGSQVDLGDFIFRFFMTEYTVDGIDYLHSLDPQRISK